MSTTVQSSYQPMIRRALHGLVADSTNATVQSYLAEASANIPFGVAVSLSPSPDRGVVLGGAAFAGITVRDLGLSLQPVDPESSTANPLDAYGPYVNVAVMTRGHVWIRADNAVAANDAVYFDYTTGTLGNSASGRSAYGSIAFTQNPVDGNTITLGGVVTTFKDTITSSTVQSQIGATLGDTLANLAKFLNASADTTLDDCTYAAYPPYPAQPGGGSGADTLLVSHDAVGTAGNSFGLVTNVTGATASGTTLSNGYAGTAAVGSIKFASQPADNSTITANGTVVTMHDGTGGTVNRGANTAATVDALVTFMNASVDAELAKVTWSAAGSPHDTLVATSDTVGTTMNAYTLAASSSPDAHATITAMTGGVPAASAVVTGARWADTVIAGQLARVALALQK